MVNIVTFLNSLGGDGLTVTDDDDPVTGLANGGHLLRFVRCLSNMVAVAGYTVTQCGLAVSASSAAQAAQALAQAAAAGSVATSLAIPTAQPNIRPSLLLDFANSERVDARVTFARASTAMRMNKFGLLESVAANVPRIEYDRLTGVCLGLMIEESRTNLVLYSEQLDNAAWSKSTSTVAANAVASPDGAVTMDTVTSAQDIGITQSIAVSNGAVYCVSMFIKLNTGTAQGVRFRDTAGAGYHIDINTQSGAITGTSGNLVSSGSRLYQNNIARVWMVYTTSAATININPRPNDAGSTTMCIWGVQVELGAFPSSYIPSTSAAVTRSADVASMTGADFSAFFRADEGTIITAGMMDYVSAGERGPYRIDDGTESNRIMLRDDATGKLEFRLISGDSSGATLSAGNALATSVPYAHAGSYKQDSFLSAFNGGNALSDTSGAVPVAPTRLLLGETAGNGTVFMCGTIAQFAFYPKQLSSTENLAGTLL